jgi:hypothetical protein
VNIWMLAQLLVVSAAFGLSLRACVRLDRRMLEVERHSHRLSMLPAGNHKHYPPGALHGSHVHPWTMEAKPLLRLLYSHTPVDFKLRSSLRRLMR